MPFNYDPQTLAAYTGTGIGAIALTYYATKKDPPIDPLYNFDQQSVEIDETEHIRVATSILNKNLVEYYFEDVRTLFHVLPKGLTLSGNGPCLGYRENSTGPYLWLTYADIIEKTRFIGSGLLSKQIKADVSTNIGIYSKNRMEWTVCEYACYAYSMNVVSLYDTYGYESIKYILNQGEIEALFLDSFERLNNVAKVINDLPHLRLIVYFDYINTIQFGSVKLPKKIELISFSELLKIGCDNLKPPVPPKPSDTATICYTSGTTGNPKGAMITHSNIISNVAAFRRRWHQPHLKVKGADSFNPPIVHYCYLPLAHMMERIAMVGLFLTGGRAGYISGDITRILDDCQMLKPNSLTLVPRVLNKFYDRVKTQIDGNMLKSMLLKRAISVKESDRLKGIVRQDTVYDKLVFQKIRNLLGGNIIRSATGSAPMSKEVYEFSRACFSCPLPEAYGQTEATCGVTCSHILEPMVGHCGPPLECVMVKLVDIPEMDYYSKDNKGEICVKGPTVFKGYYKEPEKTVEVIDKNGWLHTGDVGMWLENGCLKIIDRKKHLFKLSQGEYISPEKVEHVYLKCPLISQIFVEGDSLKDFCVAVVVPEPETVIKYCQVNLGLKGSFRDLCRNKKLKDSLFHQMEIIAHESKMIQLERVKNIYVHDELFSLENGLLTPTLKLKRIELRRYFKDIVDKLYTEVKQQFVVSKI